MTVRKKGNKWFCRFQIDGIRYERACKGATSQKEAEKCESIIKAEVMRGNYDFGKSEVATKLKDGIILFENYSKGNKLSYKSDKYYITKVIDYFGKNYPLKNITPNKIEDFKTYLRNYTVINKIKVNNPQYGKNCRKKYIYKEIEITKERANSTINRHIEMLSKMFNLCIDNGLLEINPCKSTHQLREENFKIRFLTKEEEKRMFDVINAEYSSLKPIIVCALQTGMRKSEIFNLKWNQIDFKKGFIEILKSKSGKARKIPISKRLDEELRKLLILKSNEYVFINPQTQKPYVDIKKSFSSILEKAEIEKFRFHDLRHTVATRMVENGVDLVVVQEIMGHSNIQTTMRYAHPVPERKKQAIEFLNSY